MEDTQNKTAIPKSTYDLLLQQIDQFPSLDDWWHKHVFMPAMKQFFPQFIALLVLEGGIIYVHNWIAAFLGFVIIATKIYRTLTLMSVNMMTAYLITQIRAAYQYGIIVGESKTTQNQTTNE
jgi:hypothetical protein